MPARISVVIRKALSCAVVCACLSSLIMNAMPDSFSLPIPKTLAAPIPFPDTESTWFRYRESIAYLRDRKAISGYPDGTFHPRAPINRAEFLKLVFAARGGSEPSAAADCFSDVKADAWYTPFVCAAARRKIIKGYADGSFKPEQIVNIAEAIKMVSLAYGKDIPEKLGAQWYEAYATELDHTGVFPRHSYLPGTDLLRERAADLIARAIRLDEDRILPNLSAGCGKSTRDEPSTVTVNGVERTFLLSVPKRYSPSEPTPLIIAFHGRTNSNEQVRAYYGLDRAADDSIIAYPAALKKENGSFSWSDPNDKAASMRDYTLFDALVEELSVRYCVDMNRIYTVGHSLGAWFANSVACARGGIVRASGTVGGDSVLMPCNGPTAALMIHHQRDTLASFASAEKAYAQRQKENACTAATEETEPRTLNCRRHTECDGGNTVVWCPHEIDRDEWGNVYSHQWPKGTATAIVKFFEELERQGRTVALEDR